MSEQEWEVTAGDLLISSVSLDGGIFDHSCVVILDADDFGTLGVIVNKLSETALERVLPTWVALTSVPHALYSGGPVSPEGAICLASLANDSEEPPGWRRVFGTVGLLHLDTPIEIVQGAYRDLRIYAGYTGWGPGQLRDEMNRGLWHPDRARYRDVFGDRPDTLWRHALRRQPPPVAFYSTWTPDTEQN